MIIGIILGGSGFDDGMIDLLREHGQICIPIVPADDLIKNIKKIRNSSVLYRIHCGFYLDTLKYFLLGKALKKRTILHWIGSDVLLANSSSRYRFQTKLIQRFIDRNLVVSENLATELKEIFGIMSETVPFIFLKYPSTPPPLPFQFTVLSYQPRRDPDFYGRETINRLSIDFPDIRFIILGRERETDEEGMGNLMFETYMKDINELYEQISCLIRITPHDGIALMVKEALSFGRSVIFSHPHPHCHLARNYEEVKGALVSIRDKKELNLSGRKYVIENFDQGKAIEDLIEAFKE